MCVKHKCALRTYMQHGDQMKSKQLENILEQANANKVIPATLFLLIFFTHTQGFCDAAATEEMNKMATSVVDTIFAPWVRKTALALGGGVGLFQSIGAGSFKPFMTWGGIGLLINYIPKLVNFLSTLGG